MLHFLKTRRDTERVDRCLGRPNFRTKEQDRGKKFRESIGERVRGLRLRFLADEKFRSDTKHDFKGNRGTFFVFSEQGINERGDYRGTFRNGRRWENGVKALRRQENDLWSIKRLIVSASRRLVCRDTVRVRGVIAACPVIWFSSILCKVDL